MEKGEIRESGLDFWNVKFQMSLHSNDKNCEIYRQREIQSQKTGQFMEGQTSSHQNQDYDFAKAT